MKYLPKPSHLFLITFQAKLFLLHSLHNKWVLFWGVYSLISFIFIPRVYVFGSTLIKNTAKEGEVNVAKTEAKPKSSLGSLIASREPPAPSSLTPSELEIPSLGIKTNIEHVGQTKTFEMDVPKNAANVAWYVYGAKPGEAGNAVISGHFDTPSGKPAVFYKLRSVVVGEKINVTSEEGIKTTYTIREKKLYPYTKFPSELVFHTKPGKNLNLITCAGVWDKQDKIYNERLVVFATLDEGDN